MKKTMKVQALQSPDMNLIENLLQKKVGLTVKACLSRETHKVTAVLGELAKRVWLI